jgi:hypothetical protein
MIAWLRNVLLYFVCAIAAAAAVGWIGSPLVKNTLAMNLSTIVLALLAINVQTTAVIAVKLREVLDRVGGQAERSIGQFRLAIFEQAILVVAAFAIQATLGAQDFQLSDRSLAIGCFFVLFASLHIFLDTTTGLLVTLFSERP